MTGGESIFRKKQSPLVKMILSPPPHFPIAPCREHSSLHFLQHLTTSLGVKPLVMTESSCSQKLIRRNCHTLEVTQASADHLMGVFDSCLQLAAGLGCDGIK